MVNTKWVSGQEPKAGMFIQPKIIFEPKVVEQEYNGEKSSFKQLVKYYKGAGRFKSGLPIGTTDKGEPVTMYIDIRIGKIPKPNQSGDSITQIDM